MSFSSVIKLKLCGGKSQHGHNYSGDQVASRCSHSVLTMSVSRGDRITQNLSQVSAVRNVIVSD